MLDDPALEVELVRMTDWHTDRLFGWTADIGATRFVNGRSRLVVDPERFEDDALESMAQVGQGAVYTRTTDGRRVPFVVRVETGYQNRDQYRIATLYDPRRPWKPWAPQRGWNRRIVFVHGQSCGTDRAAAAAPDQNVVSGSRVNSKVISTMQNPALTAAQGK